MKSPRKPARKTDVAIIGLGNWGTSLAAALRRARIPLSEVIVRRRKASYPSQPCRGKMPPSTPASFGSASPTPPSPRLRRRSPVTAPTFAARSSSTPAERLPSKPSIPSAAPRTEPAIASIHPVMTFPTRNPVPLGGVLFGVEASSSAARRTIHQIIRRLGGRPFDIPSKNKALYHASGTLASPLLVSQLTAAIETARLAGLHPRTAARWVEALATATARNLFAHGPSRSFSGPFARGDAPTIHLHLQALQKHPILADLYRSLALHALGTLPVRNAQALFEVLCKPSAQKSACSHPGKRGSVLPA